MKCPKCGYMSFDFNQICPKCNKNISTARDKLNLPSYRPSPPSLLGALTGEAGDSAIGLGIDGTDFSPEDSQTIEAMEEAFEDSQSLDMQIEATPEEGVHFPEEESPEGISADLGDLVLDDDANAPAQGEQVADDEIGSLDLEDLSGDETELVLDEEILGGDETEISFEEDISLGGEDESEELSLDIESLIDTDPSQTDSQDLEIQLEAEPGAGSQEQAEEIDLSDLTAEADDVDLSAAETPESLELDDDTASYDDASGDLTEIALDEEVAEENVSLDLDDLGLDLDLDLDEPDDKSD